MTTSLRQRLPSPLVGLVPAGLLARAGLLGLAAGARASLGPAAPALTARDARPVVRAGVALGVLGELTGDKLPFAGSRLAGPGPASRMLSGAIGAVWLARRAGAAPVLPALAGALGGAAGTWGGAAWRAWADRRGTDWPAALAEDAWALGCAALAVRPRAH